MAQYSNLRTELEYSAISLLAAIFRNLPLPWSRGIATQLGKFCARVLRLRRRVALDNLQIAFPEQSESEREAIYRGCWAHFMRAGAEMACLPKIDSSFIRRWFTIEGLDKIDEILEQGQGLLVVSGHLGNWEWMGGGIAKQGYPITYVVTSQSNPRVEEWLNRMRNSTGIEVSHKRDAVRGVLRALKKNRAMAIMCDQNSGKSGIFVPFFGKLASTPRGPALFHLKTGVPIVFTSAPIMPDGKCLVRFEQFNFEGLTGETEHDEYLIMAQITARLEQEIRAYPEQWLWLHRRWKTRPEGEK